ncbi:acyl-CoA synthetase [Actinoallomurus bryophytorum]|uniref:Acyl-CoA synthetase (AMP-forming)/AMP-acid ligase II n=1 Tax=Actinoallomurus bryophytorum TaxID=1490222 RepID=A0A543CN30_9ACTN|nr:acyl-CoA synthetase [Actinoallomurus bryophytorum]TQL98518.1 acyl-CoA synthetase (AMP-forming)/AMP-acid ligase II [Actinoallomurus bryophytorum]
MEFNHADLFEALADAIGDRRALVAPGPDGVERLTYAELDVYANRLAHHLEDAGVGPGQHVGVHLYNGLEYITTVLAALKLRAVPVNVNYRYVEAELEYLYNDAQLVALVYESDFEERVTAAAGRTPTLRHRVVSGGTSPHAVPYKDALAGSPATRGFAQRSGDDRYIIYTGGTTGMPKGVVWRCEDLFMAFGGGNPYGEPRKTPGEVIEAARSSGGVVMMTAAPLMHGAAQMTTFISWWMGGSVVYNRRFDAAEILRTIETEKVLTLGITGDAMARPLVDAIAAGSYDLSSLAALSSTGAILSGSVRERLSELLPNMMIIDSFGSSESGYTASGVEGSTPESGLKYRPNITSLRVLGDDLRPVEPGSGTIGQIAKTGHLPIGYWNDEAKTAKTFVEVDGERWLLTGDIATLEADGTVSVLGRGSQCINTGGEKVFPEEIEAVLKGHPAVFDVVVTGVTDEMYGQRVAAVVQLYADAEASQGDLDAHCRSRLSGYKVPRTYAFVAELQRSPAGKADYRWARKVAEKA